MVAQMQGESREKTIVLIGTMDTKGVEYGYVKDKLIEQGCRVIVVDAGILGQPWLEPDIPRERVAQAAGTNSKDVASLGREGEAIAVMAQGATKVVQELYQSGKLDGILSLGGSMGTALGTTAMRALPHGIAKVMVSTVAAGDTAPYLGTKDITMIPSVADIVGLNPITKKILAAAAGAVVGMITVTPGPVVAERPLLGITVHGDIMHCVNYVKGIFEGRGYEVVCFSAIGTGGRTLEELIEQGLINAVFDLSIHELVGYLFHGFNDAGPNRLEAAGSKGIPQLVAPGKCDMFAIGLTQEIPEHLKSRRLWVHTPVRGAVRTNEEEMAILGKVVAEKLNRAKGPAAVIIPLKGFSGRDKEGDEWHDPDVDLAFAEAVKKNAEPRVEVVEVDAHINDKLFAERALLLLDELMSW